MPDENKTEDETLQDQSSQTGNGQDWEARFKGLQATLDREKKTHAVTKQKLDQTVGAMTTELQGFRDQLTQLTTERETFKQQVTDLLGQKTTADTEAATSRKQLARFQKVAKANPALLQDLEEGLIRTDIDPDSTDFDAFLEKYAGRFANVATTAKKEVLAGASSVGGAARTPALTSQDLMKQATDALMQGDRSKYQELYDLYIKSLYK